jgi:hypothetical protein
VLLMVTSGCSQALRGPCRSRLPFPDLAAETVAEKIASTNRALAEAAEADHQAQLLLTLSLLYSHPDNPAPDYARALECLRQYAQRDPQAVVSERIRHLKALLTAVTENAVRLAQLAEENRQQAEKDKALDQKIQELERENRNMKAVIEKLKNLDIRLEKRRNRLE